MGEFIVSLTVEELMVVTQMLHMRALEPDPKTALVALDSLSIQTDLVKSNPEDHGVFKNDLVAPKEAVRFRGRLYVPAT